MVCGRGASRCGRCARFVWDPPVFCRPRRLLRAASHLVLTPRQPLMRNVLKIGTTCPAPPLSQRSLHNPSSCTSRCPSAFLSVSLVLIVYISVGGKAPSVHHPLRCIPVFPMGAAGCCACVVVRCFSWRPLASCLWLGSRCAGLAVFRAVPRFAALVVCAMVSQGGCQRSGWFGLVARRRAVAVLRAPCRRCRHKRSVIGCPGVQLSQRPRALVLVSHSSLNPRPLDITCSQVVCPDVRTPCVLLWAPCDLVPWCMIFSEVMRASSTFVPGPPPWEVTFPRLMCSCVRECRMARRAGLSVTFWCSPAGAAGLVGAVCWAASPGPPRVWLVGKGGQAEG